MDTSARLITVFYSWQSDLPNAINRRFIEKALKKAIKRIGSTATLDLASRVELDKDTQGVSGSPPIAETILAKIETCAAFVADLTFVGESLSELRKEDEAPRRLPNPNVLIEYGYALRARGDKRIVGVMNTAFGGPEHLPFDLRHKTWPIRYELRTADDSEKAAKLDELAQRLESALRDILAEHREGQSEEEKRREKETARAAKQRLLTMAERFGLSEPETIHRPHMFLTAVAEEAVVEEEEWSREEGRKIVKDLVWGSVREYGRENVSNNWIESVGSFSDRPDVPRTIVRIWDDWTVTARGEFWMYRGRVLGQQEEQNCFVAKTWEDQTISFVQQLVARMRRKWPTGRIFLQLQMRALKGHVLMYDEELLLRYALNGRAARGRIEGNADSQMVIVEGGEIDMEPLIATVWLHLGIDESPRHAELFQKAPQARA